MLTPNNALSWYMDEARAIARNLKNNTASGEAVLASVTVLANDGGKRAEEALSLIHRGDYGVEERCDQGHRYLKLPDHPTRDGRPRCPHCLAMGFDLFKQEIEGLKNDCEC